MAYLPHTIYHIYNQGNNKQIIFPQERNYLFFLDKMRKHLVPHLDILAYCLMPNHFHFLVYTNENSCKQAVSSRTGKNIHEQQILDREIATLLSGYSKAINKQEGKTGSLFRLHTKYKECFIEGFEGTNTQNRLDYAVGCFEYIHNNPVKAGLAKESIDWDYSSARDYAKLRKGTLCNQVLARELLGI